MFVLITRKSLNINELRARAGENNAEKMGLAAKRMVYVRLMNKCAFIVGEKISF